MNSTNNTALTKKNMSIYWIIGMTFVAIALAILSSSNNFRSYFSTSIQGEKTRIILAKIFTKFNDTNFVIFKIRTAVGIDIEIYEKDDSTSFQKMKQKFSFPDDKNAFLMINDNSVTLALSDIDKDGVDDIIVPTVDQYGLSRLNIFKFDSDLNQFSQSVTNE